MATEAKKSTVITNADAVGTSSLPAMANYGQGGPALLHTADSGELTGTTGVTSGSTYQLVRLPATARLKHLFAKLDAGVTTFAGDVGLYYSSAPAGVDGTVPANAGTKVGTGQEFGAAVDFHAQTAFIDLAQNVSAANLDKTLWEVGGLSSNPGGMFDIVITTTSTTSGAPVMYAEAQYVR